MSLPGEEQDEKKFPLRIPECKFVNVNKCSKSSFASVRGFSEIPTPPYGLCIKKTTVDKILVSCDEVRVGIAQEVGKDETWGKEWSIHGNVKKEGWE